MKIDERLWICVAISVGAHFAFGEGLRQLPELEVVHPPPVVAIRVISPPPPPAPPEPDPPPPPPPPIPPPPVAVPPPRTPPRIVHAAPVTVEPVETPPVLHAPTTTDTTTTPVFGVSMDSVSQGGGPAMHVGNTQTPQPATHGPTPTVVKPLAAPTIAAYEATKPPLPQGRCSGKYTDEAHAAGTEGQVVLDLIVGADGRAHDIQVVRGLPNGLSAAAVAAVQACQFTPGEKDGQPVSVKVRGFKITFVLADDQP